MKYRLEVLNDGEFESFCKDLFDRKFGIDFQIFKPGKDGGIDLRHSGFNNNRMIIQAKHYVSTRYSTFLHKLKNEELKRIQQLNPPPERYILATSLSLSPIQYDEINDALSPFIKSPDDIYGRDRIEALLTNSPEIEKRHFKLWLTSTNVLETILHRASVTNSDFHKEQILDRAKRYVATNSFNGAGEILNKHRFLIISGAPGVGKTTLAYMLICERLAYEFDLIYSDGNISEIEGLLDLDPEKKQIFFIDDFLGANLYDIYNPKNSESKIISFIEKIRHTPNKLLIFTTRTTILNQARYQFEKLKTTGITEISNYELVLSGYTDLEKAKILYNHLYHSEFSSVFTAPFFEKANYTKIIKHPNYYPRLIEFITDERKFASSGHRDVESFISDKLNNPDQIWEYAFENQIGDEDRFLVSCLFTLGGRSVEEEVLENAFEERYAYEIGANNVLRKPGAFKKSLKKLMDGWIKAEQDSQTKVNKYNFINPSVTDFMLNYVRGNKDERKRILESVKYIEQIETFFGGGKTNKIPIDDDLKAGLLYELLNPDSRIVSTDKTKYLPFEILQLLMVRIEDKLFGNAEGIITQLKKMVLDAATQDVKISSISLSIMMIEFELDELEEARTIAKSNYEILAQLILINAKEMDDLIHFAELFDDYKVALDEFLDNPDNKYYLELALSYIFEQEADTIDFDAESILRHTSQRSEDYAEERLKDRLAEKYSEFLDELGLTEYYDKLDHNYYIDTATIVRDTVYNANFRDDDYEGGRISNSELGYEAQWKEIDRMFLRD